MFPLFKQHRTLMYYPGPDVIKTYLLHFISKSDYLGFYNFYQSIKSNYYIEKNDEFISKAVSFAWDNNDNNTIQDIFFNILDYSKVTLSKETVAKIIFSNPYILEDKIMLRELGKFKLENILALEFVKFMIYCHTKNQNNAIEKDKSIETKENEESKKESSETKQKSVTFINHLEKLNKAIKKGTDEKILYNFKLKCLLRELSGSVFFKSINKKILQNFAENMKVNIFDISEKNIKEDNMKEFKPSEIKLKQEVKENKKQEEIIEKKKISLQLHIPKIVVQQEDKKDDKKKKKE